MLTYMQSEGLGANTTYDTVSLEGYMAGKAAIEVLRNVRLFARSEFLEAVYDVSTFKIADDTTLGPFFRPVNYGTGNIVSDEDGCNQGMRKVWLTRITGAGSLEYVAEKPSISFPGTCGLTHNVPCKKGYERDSDDAICTLIPPKPHEPFMNNTLFLALVMSLLVGCPCVFGACGVFGLWKMRGASTASAGSSGIKPNDISVII
jgi:hypothetical protein